MKKKKNHKIIP